MSKKGKKADEPKAAELLPADGPPPVTADQVMPSDASLYGEVETRKVGIRRVSGLDFGNGFLQRARWRPAGNSRRFWMNIEADDPFLVRPARPTDAVLEVYPTQRLTRTEGSLPKPQPDVAKAYSPRPEASEAPARPRKEVKRTAKPAPEARHTPEPRPAPTPQTKQKRKKAEPEAAREPVAPPPIERRLPPKPQNTQRSRTGRQRMPSKAKARPAAEPAAPKSAKEIREEKLRARSGPVEKTKTLDQYRNFMQDMDFMREKFEAGEEIPQIIDETADKKPRPKPKGSPDGPKEVKRKPKAAAPEPEAKGFDRTPPRPKQHKKDKPVDRSIKPGGNNAGLDDLFGGGGDRVRIGRRKKPGEGEDDKT